MKAVVPLQPQQSGFMLLAKKTKPTPLSEQATSLFLHRAQQIIGNLQTITIFTCYSKLSLSFPQVS